MDGTERGVRISAPYKLASRASQPTATVVDVDGVRIGGGNVVLIAGPCAVESEEQMMRAAHAAAVAGAHVLRGSAFTPGTSPYAFRGLGLQGLRFLVEAGKETGLPVMTEVHSPADVDLVVGYCAMLQIGEHNMQNYILLEEAGRSGKPILLKRNSVATIEEWLLAAEYILAQGNRNVILCECGIRTFETTARKTLDLSAVALARQLSHLPVIVDPCHATGLRELVYPLALASLGAGTDGLMLEVHPDPDRALLEGPQSLTCEDFTTLVERLAGRAAVLGRPLHPPVGKLGCTLTQCSWQ